MQIGMVGLGRMGLNMARRLARGGHRVVAFNRTFSTAQNFASEEDQEAAASLAELVDRLEAPRVVWLMLPAAVVDGHLDDLYALLARDDIIVEGGNSYYKDDLRRAPEMARKGIRYVDAGVSGGVWGLSQGYCTMVGGEEEAFRHIEPALKTLAPEEGYLHTGPVGSGHFVKMVHNGIEYGMMQAYAEGFDIMQRGPYSKHHDFAAISHLWLRGSVVRSWLLELMERAFSEDSRLEGIRGYVDDSGEGRWALMQAIEDATHAPVTALSLMDRFRSRQEETFGDKVLAALRNQFGAHAVKKA